MAKTDQWDEYAIVALGSNLGRSREILKHAFEQLQTLSDQPIIRSSIWKTEPVDCPPGSPPFLNAIAALKPRSGETPEHLLETLKVLEGSAGRTPKIVLNEPRPLDLDLIACCGVTMNSDRLILPHPRAHLRRFVLAPLAEIAPDLVLPNQTKSVAELLAHIQSSEVVMRLP
jgi:2-amino-4-hydroxy-6-hydroxymethyldihydropteridine diphosphokinase